MRILSAVILDLWYFLLSLFDSTRSARQTGHQFILPAPAATASLLPPLHPSVPPKDDHDDAPAITSVDTAVHAACILERVAVYHEPTVAFDNRVAVLHPGMSVAVGRRSGRFMHVRAGAVAGWVPAEAIGGEAATFPQFFRGRFYSAEDAETLKLRTFIDDDFLGGQTKTVLQGVEYVTYRIRQTGRMVPWVESWGRIAGTWQRKLRGIRGVRIDVFPHSGSIMEYIIDDIGYVAYVERVSPESTITITGVGLTHEGQYTEQVMDHALWRELRPVFIVVS